MPRAPFPGYYSFLRIIFLAIGAFMAYAISLGFWNTTQNPAIAIIAFVAVLAFWIGTLSVVFRWRV